MNRPRFESLVTGVTLMSVETDSRALEKLLLELIAERDPEATLCPSEVAQAASPEGWRMLMPAVRSGALRLAALQTIEILRGDHVLTGDSAWRGAVRIRRGPRWQQQDTLVGTH